MRSLDHRLLRQFLTVARSGSVRAAARALNMSQPPLTMAIQKLEQSLGVALFDRSVQGMRLTSAGAGLAADAERLLAELERTEQRVLRIAENARPLRIGFVSAALNVALPHLLQGLKARGEPAPTLSEMTTPVQVDALNAAEIDVGLLHPPIETPPNVSVAALGRDPLVAAVHREHPLAGRKTLRFADIVHEPLVLFPESQGPVLFNRIRDLVVGAGGTFNVAAETARLHSQLAIVAGGLGVGFMTQSAASRFSFHDVMAIKLSDTRDTLFLELALAAPSDILAHVKGLIDAAGTAS